MVEVRRVEATDWQMWREVRLAALAEAPAAFGSTLAEWQGAGDSPERWRARLSIPGACDFLAFVDGQPVGMASGVPGEAAEVVEVISMWVAPEARGRGVGDRLIDAVATSSAAQGAQTLVLAVKADNAPAIAAYERAGFAFVAGPDGRLRPDAAGELSMARPLTMRAT